MMMKVKLYISFIVALVLAGCTKQPDAPVNPDEQVYIMLNAAPEVTVAAMSNALKTNSDVVKAPAVGVGVIDELVGIDGQSVTVYGVKYVAPATKPTDFALANRVISNVSATVASDGKLNYGTPAIFPDSKVAVYALYPRVVEGGLVIVDKEDAQVPSASVTLKEVSEQQYDIMIGSIVSLDREKHLKGKGGETVNFKHALAQVKIRMYADADVVAADVNKQNVVKKVVVNTFTTGKLADITKAEFSDLKDNKDVSLYEDESGVLIEKSVKADAVEIGTPALLFPGKGSIEKVKFYVGTNEYVVEFPDTYNIEQGKISTIVVRLTKRGVVLDKVVINKWGDGGFTDEKGEIEGNMMNLQVKANTLAAPLAQAGVYKVSAQINGVYWLTHTPDGGAETIMLPATLGSDGLIKIDNPADCKMLDNGEVTLTALKIYRDNIVVYDAVASKFTPKMVVNKNTGAVTVGAKALTVDVMFTNFGDGSTEFPFEVNSPLTFDQIRNWNTLQKNFIQVKDINLAPHLAIDANLNTRPVEGMQQIGNASGWVPFGNDVASWNANYDGKGYKILGVYSKIDDNNTVYPSLFGKVGSTSNANVTYLKNINAYGKIKATSSSVATPVKDYAAGLVAAGYSVDLEHCVNYIAIEYSNQSTGTHGVGGIVGQSLGPVKISKCGNEAKIVSNSVALGGLIGIVGATITTSANVINESYNVGQLNVSGALFAVGGLVGNWVVIAEFKNCHNSGKIVVNSTSAVSVGGLIGNMPLTKVATVSNLYNNGEIVCNNVTGVKVGAAFGNYNGNRALTVTNCYFDKTVNPLLVANGNSIPAVLPFVDKLPSVGQMNDGGDLWKEHKFGFGPVLKWTN